MNGRKAAWWLGASSVGLFAFGLLFRAFLYPTIPLPHDEPTGFADLIEFVLGWLLILLLAASAIVGLVLVFKGPHRFSGAWLLTAVLVVFVLLRPAHEHVARWASQ